MSDSTLRSALERKVEKSHQAVPWYQHEASVGRLDHILRTRNRHERQKRVRSYSVDTHHDRLVADVEVVREMAQRAALELA